jgi:hypothetical protein
MHSENFTAFSRAVTAFRWLAVLVLLLLFVSAIAAVLLLWVPPQPAAITATMTTMPRAAGDQSVRLTGSLLVC